MAAAALSAPVFVHDANAAGDKNPDGSAVPPGHGNAVMLQQNSRFPLGREVRQQNDRLPAVQLHRAQKSNAIIFGNDGKPLDNNRYILGQDGKYHDTQRNNAVILLNNPKGLKMETGPSPAR